MGAKTGIQWCDHTFNPWHGCQKISPGCDNCYAAAFDHRLGFEHWGPHAERRTFGEKHWREPLAWDRAAAKGGRRRRVFCASMADVMDVRGPVEERAKLWQLITATPNLDWLLLTKRPQNFERFLPWSRENAWRNVWLGVTAENQEEADRRIPILLRTPAARRFVSYEPALELVDFTAYLYPETAPRLDEVVRPGLDWIIAGAESGAGFRPASFEWYRAVRDQCAAAGVAYFLKQHVDERGHKIGLPVLDGAQHVAWPPSCA